MDRFRLLLSLLLFSSVSLACATERGIERIIDVREKREVTREEFLSRIAAVNELVVGEKHDSKKVQDAEVRLFSEFAGMRKGRTTLAWEFWNWSEKAKLDSYYAQYFVGDITAEQFMKAVFGKDGAQSTYIPLVEAVRAAGGLVLPTNLSREEKAPVVKDGIEAIDPKLLPPGFEMGGDAYYERFVEAMGGHGDPSKVRNYFAAQCLVDDVVAYRVSGDRKTESVFLVIGDFHVRYFDGTWKRLVARRRGDSRLLVLIAESSDEDDWESVMNHPKYGPVADFLVLL